MQPNPQFSSPAREHRLYHRLQRTAHAAQRSADRAVEISGATTAQLAALSVISAEAPVAQRRVAEQLEVNESAVTAMVTRLASLGLAKQHRDVGDRRLRTLTLTPAGHAALEAADGAFATINAAIDHALAPPEVKMLADLLDKLRDAMYTPQTGRPRRSAGS